MSFDEYTKIAKECIANKMNLTKAMEYLYAQRPSLEKNLNFQEFFPTIFVIEECKQNK